MKRLTRCLLLVVSLAFVVSLSSPLPVQADTFWAPGQHLGWISFVATLNTAMQVGEQGVSFVAKIREVYQGRGQIMMQIYNNGTGAVAFILPVEIDLDDYGNITSPYGNCLFSSNVIGQADYFQLPNTFSDLGSSFQQQINLVPRIRYTFTQSGNLGAMQGCDQAGSRNLGSMKIAMKASTSQLQLWQFQVIYNTGATEGGSCTIIGWQKTIAIPNGQTVRSIGQCNWRVFNYSQLSKQMKGWK